MKRSFRIGVAKAYSVPLAVSLRIERKCTIYIANPQVRQTDTGAS